MENRFKQHILVSDLDQLTPAGKEKLRAWWKPAEGDFIYTSAWIDDKTKNDLVLCMSSPTGMVWQQMLEGALPLLSIGQMIEFLDSLDLEVNISKPHLTAYEVSIYDKYSDKVTLDVNLGFYQSLELCDALWSACVEVLNKERKP